MSSQTSDDATSHPAHDHHLFRQSMQGVVPLNIPACMPATRPKPIRLNRHLSQDHHLDIWHHTYHHDRHHATERVPASARLFYAHPATPAKRLQQLTQGRFSSHCIIDLHGCSEQQADEQLKRWIIHCHTAQEKFALIIHGKGLGSDVAEPILKNFINWWLRNHPLILAFCSALECDGGTGAVYVLLGKPH